MAQEPEDSWWEREDGETSRASYRIVSDVLPRASDLHERRRHIEFGLDVQLLNGQCIQRVLEWDQDGRTRRTGRQRKRRVHTPTERPETGAMGLHTRGIHDQAQRQQQLVIDK